MLYESYQAHEDLLAPLTALRHTRRPFAIGSVQVGGRRVGLHEETVVGSSFGTLLRFAKTPHVDQPRVLLLAPLSGHFSTLLRDTVRAMLPDHDVFISDWHNWRDVPLEEGAFGLDEYIQHVIDFLRAMGPGGHLVAVCQPVVQALAATAVMAVAEDPCQPSSLTLMAGPIDGRLNPTGVNELATSRPIEWFERSLIAKVPARYPGAARRVYPGFLQLAAFVTMNGRRHADAFADLFTNLVAQRHAEVAKTEEFYSEYFSVMDLAAEFYRETVQQVLQEHRLARGEMYWRGELVDPAAIRRTVLLTIEGERDDICGIGQTAAAQHLCIKLPLAWRSHHLQAGAGHYGVFSERRWKHEVYPIPRNAILSGQRCSPV